MSEHLEPDREYVAGFLFDPEEVGVLLIRKKPSTLIDYEFLGPITPDDYASNAEKVEQARETALEDAAVMAEDQSAEFERRSLMTTDNDTTIPEISEDCRLVAHDTGDGWALAVENTQHDVIAYLFWPTVFGETQTAAELQAKGFIIV